MPLRQALSRVRAGDRPAYVAVGAAVRTARSRGQTMVSLGAALNVDPSLLADCSRLVAAWPASEARDALASVTLAHCLALVSIRDRTIRHRLLGVVKRGALSVARTRDLARAARLSDPETAEREVQAIVAGLAALHTRLAVLVDRGTATSKVSGRSLMRASWALHQLAKRHADP